MKHKRVYILFLIGWTMSLSLQAQNNPFKIDDKLYADYQRCNKVLKEKVVLAMADSLFHKAARKGDVKAQCLAWHVKCDHYYYIEDIPSLQKAIKDARKFIEKTPFHQYLFSTWMRLISYYERQRWYGRALEEVQAMQGEAIRLNNGYGISSSYKHMANIYSFQKNYAKSLELHKKALEYAISNKETNSLSSIYQNIGAIYSRYPERKPRLDSALVYFQKALETALNGMQKIGIYARMASAELDADHPDAAWPYLQEVAFLRKKYPLYGATSDTYFITLSNYYRRKEDLDKAILFSDSITSKIVQAHLKRLIYQSLGDYKQAYEWYDTYIGLRDSTRTEETDRLLADLASRFDNERLNAEKSRLELQNSEMRIAQMTSERRLLEIGWERDTLILRATRLELNNKKLALQQKEEEVAHNQVEALRQSERAESTIRQNHLKNIILGIVVLFLFLVILFLWHYIIHRRKTEMIVRKERDIALQAQSEAEQARQEAVNANQLKSLFLQNMSHEIRTPLNAIIGFTEVLNSDEELVDFEPEERKEMLGLIETNTELLTTLINDILDLSKLESNTYVLNPTPVGVSELCHSVIASMAHRVPSGVDLRLEEPDAAHQMVLNTDAARLQQVLNNFLTNACKYTEHGSITLAYLMVGNAIEFSVADTGSGIPADKAESIFERFEKLDNFKQGTGLGLNICRRIAGLVGGRVYVDTSYTDGARFVFLHPILP
ncbi:ATP-binding protein [Bacteroides timonensis]|uniref:ATP-binding protein n=1 Tax=Bacteroides timonensis TaxID=1470345 RepID=UPI0004AF97D4|nr:ATP-binding protein [Bacteroides timonensis]